MSDIQLNWFRSHKGYEKFDFKEICIICCLTVFIVDDCAGCLRLKTEKNEDGDHTIKYFHRLPCTSLLIVSRNSNEEHMLEYTLIIIFKLLRGWRNTIQIHLSTQIVSSNWTHKRSSGGNTLSRCLFLSHPPRSSQRHHTWFVQCSMCS